ncbi:MAG: hypothetical protein H7A39_05625 [Chlamydiales bacterium]|nr:hypothetical protein [Chlamydiales bacterium]
MSMIYLSSKNKPDNFFPIEGELTVCIGPGSRIMHDCLRIGLNLFRDGWSSKVNELGYAEGRYSFKKISDLKLQSILDFPSLLGPNRCAFVILHFKEVAYRFGKNVNCRDRILILEAEHPRIIGLLTHRSLPERDYPLTRSLEKIYDQGLRFFLSPDMAIRFSFTLPLHDSTHLQKLVWRSGWSNLTQSNLPALQNLTVCEWGSIQFDPMLEFMRRHNQLAHVQALFSIGPKEMPYGTANKFIQHFLSSNLKSLVITVYLAPACYQALLPLRDHPDKQVCFRPLAGASLYHLKVAGFSRPVWPIGEEWPEYNENPSNEAIPPGYLYHQSKQLMENPVVGPDGFSYEESVARDIWPANELHPNPPLKKCIAEYSDKQNCHDPIYTDVMRFTEKLENASDKIEVFKSMCELLRSPRYTQGFLTMLQSLDEQACLDLIDVIDPGFFRVQISLLAPFILDKPDVVGVALLQKTFQACRWLQEDTCMRETHPKDSTFSEWSRFLSYLGEYAIEKKQYRFLSKLIQIGTDPLSLTDTALAFEDQEALMVLSHYGVDLLGLKDDCKQRKLFRALEFIQKPQAGSLEAKIKDLSEKLDLALARLDRLENQSNIKQDEGPIPIDGQ